MSENHLDGQRTIPLDAPQFDVSARHPRRMEKTVAIAFILSLLSFAAFGGAYWQNASNFYLGITLAFGFCFFGFGFVAWGKYLMPRGPFEEPRALMATTDEQREELIGDFASRGKVAIRRRTFLLKVMGAAGAVFGVVALFPLLRSLGPLPTRKFSWASWKKDDYLVTVDNKRVHVDDVAVGGVLTVFPAGDAGGSLSQTLLIHLQTTPVVTMPGRETWGPNGYVAFSKVCTHAGCPVGLFEEELQELLCPCHQSIFNIRAGAMPVFGPAPRPLPQLPLYVDSAGYLHAQRNFDEPIGPGFWSRGGTA